jgi:hypothetical protein
LLMNLHNIEQMLNVFFGGGGVAERRLLGEGRGRSQEEKHKGNTKKMLHTFLRESLPDYLHRITLKVRIGSDEREFFFDALRDQDPVEGVAVVHGQRFDP